MKHNYQENRDNKKANLSAGISKNKSKVTAHLKRAADLQRNIPLGQPILVGHHSERRHRGDLNKIDNSFRAANNAEETAVNLELKLRAMKLNTSISSDDPEALQKLKDKFKLLTEMQDFMKAANKCVKTKNRDVFLSLPFGTEKMWEKLNTPDCFRQLGFPLFKLTNNNANIRTTKLRMDQLLKESLRITSEKWVKGIRVVENAEANRIQLFFPNIPSITVREKLSKVYYFKFCRSEGAWQRFLNNAGKYAAQSFIDEYTEENQGNIQSK